jgi:ferredoxin
LSQPLLYGFSATDVTRNFFFNTGTEAPFMAVLLPLVFLLACVCTLYRFHLNRLRWFSAAHNTLRAPDRDGFRHLFAVFKPASGELIPWLVHTLIFSGMVIFPGIELLFALQGYILFPLVMVKPFSGYVYLFLTMMQDVAVLMILAGVLAGLYRRFVVAPSRLDRAPVDALIPVLLLVLVISRTLTEALRIRLTGFPAFEKWAFFSYTAARFPLLPDGALAESVYYIFWSVLMLTLLVMIGAATMPPLSRYVNALYARLVNPRLTMSGTLACAAMQGPLDGTDALDARDLLDVDSCLLCGRCQDRCPATMSGSRLSPKEVLRGLRDAIEHDREPAGAVPEDALSDCLFCGACVQSCPADISIMSKLLRLRQNSVRTSDNGAADGNPFGLDSATRGVLLQELFPELVAVHGEHYDVLVFAGCAAAYNQDAAQGLGAIIRLALAAGKKTGLAVQQEMCCGEPLFFAGDMDSFRRIAGENHTRLMQYHADAVVTACPHCALTLDQLYRSNLPERDFSAWNIRHHSDMLLEMRREGLVLPAGYDGVITSHDSCRLGRYRAEYDGTR